MVGAGMVGAGMVGVAAAPSTSAQGRDRPALSFAGPADRNGTPPTPRHLPRPDDTPASARHQPAAFPTPAPLAPEAARTPWPELPSASHLPTAHLPSAAISAATPLGALAWALVSGTSSPDRLVDEQRSR